jgi:hypothetical protein
VSDEKGGFGVQPAVSGPVLIIDCAFFLSSPTDLLDTEKHQRNK